MTRDDRSAIDDKPEDITPLRAAELAAGKREMERYEARKSDRLQAHNYGKERHGAEKKFCRVHSREEEGYWIEQYESGISMTEIASVAGCAISTVWKAINKAVSRCE